MSKRADTAERGIEPGISSSTRCTVVHGSDLLVAPRDSARSWLGEAVDSGATRVAARGPGARDVPTAAGRLVALRPQDPAPWLAGLGVSDAADVLATPADRDQLPRRATLDTAVVATAFMASGIGLAVAGGG